MENYNQTELRNRYPHMVPNEIRIWNKFQKKYGSKFDMFRYDVHVGKGIGPVPGYDKKYQDMAIRLTQKRIDVVAYRGSNTYIIEIKDKAGLSAIGQLIAYKKLYEDQYGVNKIKGLAIVATSADQDIRKVAGVLNIKIFIV